MIVVALLVIGMLLLLAALASLVWCIAMLATDEDVRLFAVTFIALLVTTSLSVCAFKAATRLDAIDGAQTVCSQPAQEASK